MKGFKSTRHLQRFVSIHDPVANLFHILRHDIPSHPQRELRTAAMQMWSEIAMTPSSTRCSLTRSIGGAASEVDSCGCGA